MAIDWFQDFFKPLIIITFVGGLISWVGFYVFRGINRQWNQQTKWFLKYKIGRKSFSESTLKWCLDAIENGMGYYEAKKLLFIHNGTNMDQVYETLYIYEQVLKEFYSENKQKGGENGGKFKRSYSSVESKELPTQSGESSREEAS